MRRAGHKHTVSTSAVLTEPHPLIPQSRLAARSEPVATPLDDPPETQVVISAEGTFLESGPAISPSSERQRQLVLTIRQRIESRLAGRIRDLAVRIKGGTVVLEGRCATYYTKQLAQHAALGVLEHELLENAIVVAVPR